jgi:hypothetical protein
MIRSTIFLCAQQITTGESVNSLTIHNIIEQMSVAFSPTLIPEIYFLCVFKREDSDPETIKCILEVYLGDDKIINSPFPVYFQGNSSARSIIQLKQLQIPKSGIMRATVSLEGRLLNTYEVQIDTVSAA